jgi:hypothetical protein
MATDTSPGCLEAHKRADGGRWPRQLRSTPSGVFDTGATGFHNHNPPSFKIANHVPNWFWSWLQLSRRTILSIFGPLVSVALIFDPISWKSCLAQLTHLTSQSMLTLFVIEDTRYQLSYMTNFALLLFVQSPSMAVARENKLLLDKWRSTVRMQSRAWPVLKLAVMRLDAVVWKGLDNIVSWAGKDSPAEVLLRKPPNSP